MDDLDIISIHHFLMNKYKADDSSPTSSSSSSSNHAPARDDTFYFYLMRAIPLLDQYNELHKSRAKVQFMGKNADEIELKHAVQSIIKDFLKLLQDYFPDDFHTNNWDKMRDTADRTKKKIPETIVRTGVKIKCVACSSESFSIYDNHFVCERCGVVSDNTHNHISYKDIDRVNVTSKYTYDRRTHFRDCINQFQGKQNASIDPSVYEDLKKQFVLHNLTPANYKDLPASVAFADITREHVILFLKETNHPKHYEDVVLIHATLTKKPPPDISHLENILLQDFDTLTEIYDKKYKTSPDRKNFINTQYVLYQLLRRHKYPCRKEDFNILKTVDRKYYHDNVCADLFQQLGWNLHPLF